MSTASRSSVELTAWPTSPRAWNSPTELRQFVGSRIEFFEQSDILDGDDGLVGERFEELDCAGVNGRTSVRRALSDPMSSPC